jgi:hypothetical protein
MFVFNFLVSFFLICNVSTGLFASDPSSILMAGERCYDVVCKNPIVVSGYKAVDSSVKVCSEKIADTTGFEQVRDCNCAKLGIGSVTFGAITALVVCAAKVGLSSNVYTRTSVKNDCSDSVIVAYPGCKNGCHVSLDPHDQITIRSFGSLGQLCVKGTWDFFYETCATKKSLQDCKKFSITQDSSDYVFNSLCSSSGIHTNSSVKYYKSSEYTGPYTSDVQRKTVVMKELLATRGNLRGAANE